MWVLCVLASQNESRNMRVRRDTGSSEADCMQILKSLTLFMDDYK